MKLLYSLILLPFLSDAFQVDAMIKIADEKNENYIVIDGNSDGREYLYVSLSEIISNKGRKAEEINFDANNLPLWPIIAEPSDIILERGEQVRVKIAKNFSVSQEDRVFGITFTPDVVTKDKNKQYNLPFGFKTWFIVPGQNVITGNVSAIKGSRPGVYVINNDTNKVMDVSIQLCKNKKNCTSSLLMKPWSQKQITLQKMSEKTDFTFNYFFGGTKEEFKRVTL